MPTPGYQSRGRWRIATLYLGVLETSVLGLEGNAGASNLVKKPGTELADTRLRWLQQNGDGDHHLA